MAKTKSKKRKRRQRLKKEAAVSYKPLKRPEIDEEQAEEDKNASELQKVLIEQQKMMNKMGLPTGFDSTKGKSVENNDVSATRVRSKRQYRQYMNKSGGFNRTLAKSY